MAKSTRFVISLPAAQTRSIVRRVKQGAYRNPSEVVRAALVVLDEDEKTRRSWRRKIAAGMAQAKKGEVLDGEKFFDDLRAIDGGLRDAAAGRVRPLKDVDRAFRKRYKLGRAK